MDAPDKFSDGTAVEVGLAVGATEGDTEDESLGVLKDGDEVGSEDGSQVGTDDGEPAVGTTHGKVDGTILGNIDGSLLK